MCYEICYMWGDLSQIESLNKALGFSMNENFRLKAQIAKV